MRAREFSGAAGSRERLGEGAESGGQTGGFPGEARLRLGASKSSSESDAHSR
jgi:hypothetical protein